MTGQDLSNLMYKHGLTTVGLAHALGVTVPTVYKLLNSAELSTVYQLAIRQLIQDMEGAK